MNKKYECKNQRQWLSDIRTKRTDFKEALTLSNIVLTCWGQHSPWTRFPCPHASDWNLHHQIFLHKWIFHPYLWIIRGEIWAWNQSRDGISYKSNRVSFLPLWLVKSPPWHIKSGMTRWKLDPLYPNPGLIYKYLLIKVATGDNDILPLHTSFPYLVPQCKAVWSSQRF